MSRTSRSEVSPPPSKRRRVNDPARLAPTLPLRPLCLLESTFFRIFTWNVNGIKPFLQPSITSFFQGSLERDTTHRIHADGHDRDRKSHSLRRCLKRWDWPQVVCLQEVKIAHHDTNTQKAAQQALKNPNGLDEPAYRAFFNLPSDKHNAKGFGGKLYGVCTLVRNDVFEDYRFVDQGVTVDPVDWEREGRVLVMRLPKSKIMIVNVYAVNGTEYPYRNDSGQEEGTRHDFKRRFHTHLRDMVLKNERFGWCVVVAGDLNIAQDLKDGFPGIRLGQTHVENRQDFHDKFIKEHDGGAGMVDSYRQLHPNERKYTYRSPNIEWGASCDRVDLILVDGGMPPDAVKEADIMDAEPERGPSDHLPCYITLDTSVLRRQLDSVQTS